MAESSSKANKATPEELSEILSKFKDVLKPGTGELFIGGVRPPRKQEKQPDEKREAPENSKSADPCG